MQILNVLTPFSRKENKDILIKHLEPFKIIWHPIIHEDIDFGRDWIHPLRVKLPEFTVDYCYFKLNTFLYSVPVNKDEYYLFLNDDDFYEKKFFDKLKPHLDSMVLVVSMKRGNLDIILPETKHPTTTLLASQDNMRLGKIGLEQMILRGDAMNEVRFLNWPGADGVLAEMLKGQRGVTYLPDIYVYFNYLEKGRW